MKIIVVTLVVAGMLAGCGQEPAAPADMHCGPMALGLEEGIREAAA